MSRSQPRRERARARERSRLALAGAAALAALATLAACATGRHAQRPASGVAAVGAPSSETTGRGGLLSRLRRAAPRRTSAVEAPPSDASQRSLEAEAAAYDSIATAIAALRARREALEQQLGGLEQPGADVPAPAVAAPAESAPLVEAERARVRRRVYFATNSARLTAVAEGRLVEKLEILRAHPALTMELVGHADARGNPDYNQRLSERRALAAKEFLVARGVEPERLRAEGRGSREPAAEGSGPAAWRENRRVDFDTP